MRRQRALLEPGMLSGLAPSPIPAPLPPWARFLVQVAPLISAGLQAALEYLEEMQPSTASVPDEWRHIQVISEPVTATHSADNCVTTFDVVNITSGAIDSSWTDADYTAVQAALNTACVSWATKMSNSMRFKEMRFYRRVFTPVPDPVPPKPWPPAFERVGEPERIFSMSAVGAVTTHQASQVAMTSTDITPYARHWGRNYWPRPSSSMVGPTGYIGSADVDFLVQLVQSLYADWMGNEFYPVVPVTQIQAAPARGLLGVSAVQVDNVFDVQRKRRLHTTTYRARLPV